MPRGDKQHDGISRRNWVKVAGASGIAALAGCFGGDGEDDPDEVLNDSDGDDGDGGDGDGGDGDTDGDDVSDVADEDTVSSFTYVEPDQTQYNGYRLQNQWVYGQAIVYPWFAVWSQGFNEYVPEVISDWSLDGVTMTLQVNDAFTHHNGEDLTAEDVLTKLKMERFMGHRLETLTDEVQQTGDYEVELTLSEERNPDIINNAVLTLEADAPSHMFGEYIEMFEDASTDSEREDVQAQVIEFAPQEPAGAGPWMVSDTSERRNIYSRFDDFPHDAVQEAIEAKIDYEFPDWAGPLDVERCDLIFVTGQEPLNQELTAGNMDLGAVPPAAPQEVRDQWSNGVEVAPVSAYGGSTIHFNHDDDVYGQREVRQALAHIINRGEVGQTIYGDYGIEIAHISGMAQTVAESQLSDDFLDTLNTYEVDHDRARSLLNEAGFEESGGSWVDESGETLRVQIMVAADHVNQVQGFEHAVALLRDFGLEAEVQTVDNTTYYGSTLPEGDFEIGQATWGNGPPPFFVYNEHFTDAGAEVTDHYPTEVTVPEVGNPEGDSVTINVEETLDELASSMDEDAATEATQKLAWVFNQDLPNLTVVEKLSQHHITRERWQAPEEGSPMLQCTPYPQWWLHHAGLWRKQ